MTLNKKILFKLKLLTLVLALGTACDEAKDPEGETPATTTTTITYTAEQVGKPAPVGGAFGPVNHMAKSLNGSTLYVAEAAALHAIGAAGTPVALETKTNLSLGGAAVGKANLSAGPGVVTHLSPSATGVLATLDSKNVALYNGAAVAPTNGWLADNGGSNDVANLTHNASAVKAFMANDTIYLNDLHVGNLSRFLTIPTAAPGTALAKITNVVQAVSSFGNASAPFMASVNNKAFVVDRKGVFQFNADGAAVANVADPIAPAAAANWAVKGKPAVLGGAAAAGPIADAVNTVPSCVLINNNKLYVGFTKTANTDGGVAIYNLDAAHAITTFVPTSFASRDTSVVALTAHGNDVYAVLDDKILKVVEGTGTNAAGAPGAEVALVGDLSAYYGAKKADGTAGFHFAGAAAGAAGTAMGAAVAAEFMGEDLYVGTTTGLYKFTKTTVTK